MYKTKIVNTTLIRKHNTCGLRRLSCLTIGYTKSEDFPVWKTGGFNPSKGYKDKICQNRHFFRNVN